MEFLSEFYYTNLFNGILILLLIVIGIIYYKQLGKHKLLFLYCIIAFLQLAIAFIASIYDSDEDFSHINFSINLFVLFEFLIFNFFIFSNIINKNIRAIIILISIVFVFVLIKVWVINKGIYEHPTLLSIIESFSIITFSLFYYYENTISNSVIKFNDPSIFWAITGILILFALMTPLLLVNEFFPHLIFSRIYVINNISYLIFYLILSYSFKCKLKST